MRKIHRVYSRKMTRTFSKKSSIHHVNQFRKKTSVRKCEEGTRVYGAGVRSEGKSSFMPLTGSSGVNIHMSTNMYIKRKIKISHTHFTSIN